MDDFIFGTLATDELRLKHVRSLRAGVTYRNVRSPRDPLPGQAIQLELTVGPEHICDRAWAYWSTDGEDPDGELGKALHGSATPMELVSVEWDTLLWGYVQHFRVRLPGQAADTVVRYRLSASTMEGQEIFADGGAFYALYVAEDPLPVWAQNAVVYQIFVDRFNPGEGKSWRQPETPAGFYGGTLRGITEKLDYLQELGANVLWLTPIFPSPSHHGYDATGLFDVEPRLGTLEDFRELADSAHARGIRILLDFVPNHWSSLHPTFQEAISDPDSRYVDWYNFESWPDEYETFFGVKSLPQINLRNPGARQHVLDAGKFWLEQGADGYRVDYAIGPTQDFWADFRRETRKVKSDSWTFGEVVEPSDSQIAFHGLLDGCLDFVLLEGIRQTLAFGRWRADEFASFIDRHDSYFPADFSRPSFLDNHDMNRFLWAVQGDQRRLKIAALCQFTLPGAPVIYYGTEVGLSQERDVRQAGRGLPEESRLPMLWGQAQDAELLAFYQKLIALRREETSLQSGVRRKLHADENTITYIRELGKRKLATAINVSEELQKLSLGEDWQRIVLDTDSGCRLEKEGGEVILHLPAFSGVILS